MVTVAAGPTEHGFAGLCLDCNYALRDIASNRCPECGRAFDPADPSTVNTGRPVPLYAAWATGPISWPVCLLALIGCGVTLWHARLPALAWTWTSPVLVGWAVVAGAWFAWPAVRLGVLRHYRWPPRVIRPMGRWHWLVPLLMVAMVVGSALDAPRDAAFRFSRPAMDQLARDVLARPNEVFDPRWVGLYHARNIETVPGGMAFTADDRDARFKVGFAYIPRLNPSHISAAAYHSLGHGWWDWRQGG